MSLGRRLPSGQAHWALRARQREKVPGCGEEGQGDVVVACPCAGHGDDSVFCCAGGCACCGQGAGCTVACVGGGEVGFGFATRFGLGLGFGSDLAALDAAVALLCSGARDCAASGGGWFPLTYSGGIPCVTPGTPPGKTSLRSPGSFFFSFRPNMSSLSGSKSEHAVSVGANATRPVSSTAR